MNQVVGCCWPITFAVAFEVIESVWPVVFAACTLGVLVFLRTVSRVRQEHVQKHEAYRAAIGMRLDYIQRKRSHADSKHGGYQLVG